MHHLLKHFNITDAQSGGIQSISPIDGSIIGSVKATTSKEYDEIVKQSQHAFGAWREMPAPKRGDIIRQLGDTLRHNKNELGSLVSLEMGKSKQEGDGEVQEMIDMAEFAVGQSRMLYGQTMHSERPNHRMYEQWHPLGVVGVISAFNFPVAVWAWNAFIAAICGDTVIWKPSPKTPFCAIAVHKLCEKVMQDNNLPNIFSLVISDDITFSRNMVNDSRIPLISFTGSTSVGREVGQQVAARFGRSLLELSGNNAAIIDQTADLTHVIPAIVFGAVGTAGQRCTSSRRLLVHESIYNDVLKRLTHAYGQLKIGDPLDQDNHVGPVIDQSTVNHFQKAIEKVKSSGGKILKGGNVLQRPGYYVEPTIAAVDCDNEVACQENFCPILFVMRFNDIDDAIAINNQVNHGLSSAIFTKDLTTAERFLSAAGSDCGIANVNIGTSGAEIGGAFGGEKQTGGGREAGSDSWKAYMRRQTNTINWGKDLPLAQGIQFSLD